MKPNIYDSLREKFIASIKENNLESDEIIIRAAPLSAEEAIGRPKDRDYPLIVGRERLMQAEFQSCYGQAFTDMYDNYNGCLLDVASMALSDNFQRAVFIASLNAVMRYLRKTAGTVHCRDEEPRQCANELADYIEQTYGHPRVAFIGFQPRMIEALSSKFEIMVTDLDEKNIGAEKFGVIVCGPEKTEENLNWCDIALVTGTTIVNGTIEPMLKMVEGKEAIFYGTTISGTAELLGLKRFCRCGH
ncbi:MAG: DUF364 domain-containing protein [Dehalococcoidales bacterium]|nr:DUF364 domain-containing protein [Dehalococcoidales bacterium]